MLEREQKEEKTNRSRNRFEAINDLLFWGAHICIVGISLAIIWSKIDSTNKVMQALLNAQEGETALTRRQVAVIEEQTASVKRQEQLRSRVVDQMMTTMTQIEVDIRKTLAETLSISQQVLDLSEQSKAAAILAAKEANSATGAASTAANAAFGAASAARSAANTSYATKNTVAAKVVTSSDKKALEAQQRALAAKRQQLSLTIKQVRKTGPNILQQIFH